MSTNDKQTECQISIKFTPKDQTSGIKIAYESLNIHNTCTHK